jgi:hypothetical protein
MPNPLLEKYLTHYNAYQEVGEGRIGYLDAANPTQNPVISIGHGACSVFVFVDVDKTTGDVKKAIVFHSSLNGFASYQSEIQKAAFLTFLCKSENPMGFAINRWDKTGEGFMKSCLQLAKENGCPFVYLPPIEIGKPPNQGGLSVLLDIRVPESIKVPMNDGIEAHNIKEHIAKSLQAPQAQVGGIDARGTVQHRLEQQQSRPSA